MKLQKGVQQSLIRRDAMVSGSADVQFETLSDSLLVTLFAEVLTGTLDVSIWAITVGGPADSTPAQEIKLFSFPTISAPSTDLLIQTAAAVTQRLRIKATWIGAAKFDVQARAIDGGTSKSQVITAGALVMDKVTINAGAPQILIPFSLTESVGFLVKNWSSNGAVVYVAETTAKATPSLGFPIAPGDTFDVSVKAGQAYYASSSINGADLRIIKGGEN